MGSKSVRNRFEIEKASEGRAGLGVGYPISAYTYDASLPRNN